SSRSARRPAPTDTPEPGPVRLLRPAVDLGPAHVASRPDTGPLPPLGATQLAATGRLHCSQLLPDVEYDLAARVSARDPLQSLTYLRERQHGFDLRAHAADLDQPA